MYTRRDLGKLALASLPVAALAKPNSRVRGVMMGAQSYSFRDRSLDDAIKAMGEIGLSYVELWQGHVEPRGSREEVRKWRLSVPMEEIRKVRAKLDAAGINLYAYNYSFRDDFSDAEIERGFEFAHALGVKYLTASGTVTVAKRISPFAERAKVFVGMHNHSNIKPNEFARPDDFAEAMRDTSSYIGVNLDTGHFTAAGFDPVDYLAKHHDRIYVIHIKDRKKNQGPNVAFGLGDTPNREVLCMLRDKKWPIPAMIEYEYKGADTVAEVKKCYAWMKQAVK
jgi:sugar phosphate isomerase/epimerase